MKDGFKTVRSCNSAELCKRKSLESTLLAECYHRAHTPAPPLDLHWQDNSRQLFT